MSTLAPVSLSTDVARRSSPQFSGAGQAASLHVEHVRHGYAGNTVLDDLTWQARAGELVCLLGHSGCGKSTLLRLIAGLEAPSAGRILIGEQEISSAQRFVAPELRGVGLVFQDYALFPHLSVLANVMFGLRDMPRRDARVIARRWLDQVELGDRAESFTHTLSGGEQQRVALARALAPSPRVLLMDEPFSNLDRSTREAVRSRTIRVLREARTTVVLVTHDAEEALRVADRIVLMHDGRIAQIGTPRELWEQPAGLFTARFFGHWNELPALCDRGVALSALGAFPTAHFNDGARVIVCIPVSAIRLVASGVEGIVLERDYLGDDDLLRVAVTPSGATVNVRVSSKFAPAVGQRVYLQIDADAVRIFAEPSPAAVF